MTVDHNIFNEFGPKLSEILSQRLKSNSEERQPTLRMSNIGRPLRQLYYELNGYKGEEISGKTRLKFLFGDLTEALVLVLAEASGHKVERLQEEIEVDGIKGHIDAVIDGCLVDVKSASPYSFAKFSSGELFSNDPFGYVGQISGYAHALGLPARFIAVNKVLGDICTLEIPQERIDAYDIQKRIQTVRDAVSAKEVPERCYEAVPHQKSGNYKLDISCSYCGFKEECWKDSNNGQGLKKYQYSTGPVWLTKTVREPSVFQSKSDV